MFNFCTQHSSTPSLCINNFITIADATPRSEDILFDLKTFNNLFIYDSSGKPKKLPEKYIIGLTTAANRWNKFIRYQDGTLRLIRTINNGKERNWKGIQLLKVTYIDEPILARTKGVLVAYTSLNVGFQLELNDASMNELSSEVLSDVLTHELGHALGFAAWEIRKDGKPDGELLLPKIISNESYVGDPLCVIDPPNKNMVAGYNSYWGTIDWLNRKEDTPSALIGYSENSGLHLITGYYGSVEPPPVPSTRANKYIKRGLYNEIMVENFNEGVKYYISNVSLGYLLDVFTSYNGKNFFNYERKIIGSEVKSFTEPRPGSEYADYIIYFNGQK